MSEFTDEQEALIQERIAQAEKSARENEQWKMGGDMFYRLALSHITTLAQQNVCDPFVVQVGQALHGAFRRANFPQPADQPPLSTEPTGRDVGDE
jgi:hypothetical protein